MTETHPRVVLNKRIDVVFPVPQHARYCSFALGQLHGSWSVNVVDIHRNVPLSQLRSKLCWYQCSHDRLGGLHHCTPSPHKLMTMSRLTRSHFARACVNLSQISRNYLWLWNDQAIYESILSELERKSRDGIHSPDLRGQ